MESFTGDAKEEFSSFANCRDSSGTPSAISSEGFPWHREQRHAKLLQLGMSPVKEKK